MSGLGERPAARVRRYRDDLLVVAAALIPLALFVARERQIAGGAGLPLDDSWIHLHFARNIAEGAGFSFNPGTPVAGSTAPLWTCLLAAGAVVAAPSLGMVKVLGVAATLGAALLTRRAALAWGARADVALAEAQQVVRFGTRIVLASDGPPPSGPSRGPEPPDERLEAFLPRLRQLFRYQGYTSLERYRAEVPVGTTQRWPVPGDRRLEVTPQGVRGGSVTFNVRLTRGAVAEVTTNIQAQSGNPAVIGGPRHGSGTLIIILWTNPTP